MKSRALAMMCAALLTAAPATAQTAAEGKKVFMRLCQSCHYAPDKPDVQPRLGPSLKGVVGRKAAAAPGYTRYSPAMKKSGKLWDAKTLDAYLTAPRTMVPGTTMGFVGLKDAKQRAALIAYLKAPTAK